MEIFILAALIIVGSFGSFLASVLSSLSVDKVHEYLQSGSGNAATLHELKLNFETTIRSYFIIEMLFYMIAALVLGTYVTNNYQGILPYIYSFMILFPVVILLRSLLQAVGIRSSDKLALKLTPLLYFFYIISKPFIIPVMKIIDGVGGDKSEEASRDEITALVESAMEEGSLDADEYRILKSIMHFSDVYVSDVMTPRTVMYSARADETVGDIVGQTEIKMFSRFPVWEGESIDDKVVGYVMTRDVLYSALTGKNEKQLKDLAREVYFIPENVELDKALENFLKRRQHLFVVVDEYGGVEGLITMEDVIETILGVEIADETDRVLDLRALAKQRRDKRVAAIAAKK